MKPVQQVVAGISQPAAHSQGRATISSIDTGVRPTGDWNRNIEPLLARIAASDLPILVSGETGTGKEVVARRIHALSGRAGEVFLKLNCAALPSELVESALFGYERGVFTGVHTAAPGQFKLADKGTILLDEIGDMELKLQAKLVQVLQDQQFLPLGAKEPTRVDVRIIATSHCNLEALVAQGAFRQDLYYRLKVLNIAIPPLRERRDEIIPLALSFLHKYNCSDDPPPEISAKLSAALVNYSWPGNIRELENAMRSYLVVRDPEFLADELCDSAARAGDHRAPAAPVYGDPQHQASALARVEENRKIAETELILRTLSATFWNRKRAAMALGMDYRAFLYKMKKLGIMEIAHVTEATEEAGL